ncbi:MAG: pantoate--beta-alanine ligase [Phycisphaerales bacterium]|jgi:pantoate--beta-alanine ligase|nr:pantoate--beta-alanine ligase [Phycisphaerales bacterium]
MRVATTHQELGEKERRVFVPTMGALHAGHASLIRQAAGIARARGGEVAVSIFVNPTQFNEAADYRRYPRTLGADAEVCRAAGADVVFAPEASEVYPPGRVIRVPDLPRVAKSPGLEDAQRPGHFAGVCQVVLRLFELVRPSVAVFGEKDWQQLQVIRAMTAQEKLAIEIVPGATVREADGLAMSSRNRFLGEDDRRRALSISRVLRESGRFESRREYEAWMVGEMQAAGLMVEYAVVRDGATLEEPGAGVMRALIAARVGSVRLIDNSEVRFAE